MSHRAYIALGSNLGDRAQTLDAASERLRTSPGVTLISRSRYYETAPVGGPPGQSPYLNAAAHLHTTLSPDDLLALLHLIEADLGRVRSVQDAPRTLDLDLLLYDDLVRIAPAPIVPHPRMHLREFVLQPLADIAPDVLHPVLHQSITQLLEQLQPRRELTGLNALVTGSTSGIGRAIALTLAERGANIIVHGRRSEQSAREVRDLCVGQGVRADIAMANLADMHDPAVAGMFVGEVWGRFGHLDIAVLNAGADTLTGEAAKWPFERKLQHLLAIDLVSTMMLGRELGAAMQTRGGLIVTVGWDQAETGMEGDSGQLFAAVKAGVMAFTRSLSLSLAPKVRVNCVAPGWIQTAWGETASTVWQERVLRETPLARWGKPADIASAVCWLASPAASFVTGQTIRINGGAVRG